MPAPVAFLAAAFVFLPPALRVQALTLAFLLASLLAALGQLSQPRDGAVGGRYEVFEVLVVHRDLKLGFEGRRHLKEV